MDPDLCFDATLLPLEELRAARVVCSDTLKMCTLQVIVIFYHDNADRADEAKASVGAGLQLPPSWCLLVGWRPLDITSPLPGP